MRRIAIVIVSAMLAATSLPAANSGAPQQSPGVTGSPIPGVAGYGVELGLDPASGKVLELLVYRGQKQVQALKVCTPEPVPRESPVGTMDTADYNFDGHGDLALETAFKQGNASYCYGCSTRKRSSSWPRRSYRSSLIPAPILKPRP